MKAIIVCYSQTGNTKKIADAIHAGLSPLMERCDLRLLKDVKPARDLRNYDLIGLGGPVWGDGIPHIIRFIEEIRGVDGKLGFAFCTHGTLPRPFLGTVVPAMTQRGLTIIGWNDWYGACHVPMLPKPYFTDGHPDEIDLKEAKKFGKELGNLAKRISGGETDLIPVFPRGKDYDARYGEPLGEFSGLPENAVTTTSYPLVFNMEKCTRCNLCVDNCPTNSIDFSESPPLIRFTCAKCWLCEQICPVGAIEYDWGPATEACNKVIDSLFISHLAEAEAKGYFRRLTPLEKVGFNTPWYKVKQTPRLKWNKEGYFEPM